MFYVVCKSLKAKNRIKNNLFIIWANMVTLNPSLSRKKTLITYFYEFNYYVLILYILNIYMVRYDWIIV